MARTARSLTNTTVLPPRPKPKRAHVDESTEDSSGKVDGEADADASAEGDPAEQDHAQYFFSSWRGEEEDTALTFSRYMNSHRGI